MVDDESRFVALCQQHHGKILGFVLRRTNTPDDAADIAAEVFLTAWRRIREVPVGEAELPWLYATARHVLANQYRGQRRRRQLIDRLSAEVPSDGPADPEFTYEDIAAAFASLKDGDREVLALVAWEGLGHDALATVLGCTRASARVRVHRARRRFAAALAAQGELQRIDEAGHLFGERPDSRTGTRDPLWD